MGGGGRPPAPTPGPADLARLNHRLAEVAAIDHFSAPERRTIERVVARLEAHVRAAEPRELCKGHASRRFGGTRGRTWVTRRGGFVDPTAGPWRIRRVPVPAPAFHLLGPTGQLRRNCE